MEAATAAAAAADMVGEADTVVVVGTGEVAVDTAAAEAGVVEAALEATAWAAWEAV